VAAGPGRATPHVGALVVDASVADDVLEVFSKL
jgi:hypothetical protein